MAKGVRYQNSDVVLLGACLRFTKNARLQDGRMYVMNLRPEVIGMPHLLFQVPSLCLGVPRCLSTITSMPSERSQPGRSTSSP